MQDTSKMTPKELYDYRVRLYRDAQSWKKPDRIPICGNMFTWMFLDAGYSPTQAARDYKIIEECMIRFAKTYKVDEINVLNGGHRNGFLVSDSLGGSNSYTDQNAENLNAIFEDMMLPDEYDEILEDFNKWVWEKGLPRKFPQFKDMTPEQIAKAAKTAPDHFNAKYQTNKRLHEELGLLQENDIYGFCNAFENLSGNYRGMKGVSMDMRRRKQDVQRFCDVMDAQSYAGFKAWLDQQPEGPNMQETCDVCMWLLGYTFTNLKQFEAYYTPLLEKVIIDCEAKGKQIIFWSEGSWERYGAFFNQFKKGTVCMMVETDNIFEIREKYPNVSLMGGIDRDLLSAGTPDQCVAQVQKVIDELGKEGGLILQPSKMISYANDCRAENLKAVCDFVTSYEI